MFLASWIISKESAFGAPDSLAAHTPKKPATL